MGSWPTTPEEYREWLLGGMRYYYGRLPDDSWRSKPGPAFEWMAEQAWYKIEPGEVRRGNATNFYHLFALLEAAGHPDEEMSASEIEDELLGDDRNWYALPDLDPEALGEHVQEVLIEGMRKIATEESGFEELRLALLIGEEG